MHDDSRSDPLGRLNQLVKTPNTGRPAGKFVQIAGRLRAAVTGKRDDLGENRKLNVRQ
jgi:hypothetical protein